MVHEHQSRTVNISLNDENSVYVLEGVMIISIIK